MRCHRLRVWSLLLLSIPSLAPAQSTNLYRIVGNSIRVDQASLWGNWICQNDLVSMLNAPVGASGVFILDENGLRPRFFRRTVNAAVDATQFIYTDLVRTQAALVQGGVTALSNSDAAPRVADDDLSTYWEPATPPTFEDRLRDPRDFSLEGLRDWEFLLDLGRLVFADSLTVVFPAGEHDGVFLGEPVKSFALFASMGERFPFPLGTGLEFTLVGQLTTGYSAGKPAVDAPQLVSTPGTDGRYVQVTWPMFPLTRADWDLDGRADITGGFVHYLKLKVTDSNLWRSVRVGSGEEGRLVYEALPPARQGAKVYQRYMAGGLLTELRDDPGGLSAKQKYDALPAEKRGSILYYAKEVPRVSELRVWAKGDNYALHPERRGGGAFENGGLGSPELATDGLYDTEWQANTWSPLYEKGTAWWDLGAVFWIDNLYVVNKRVGVYSNLEGGFSGPSILVSDGALLKPLQMEQLTDFPQLEDGLKWDNVISDRHVDNRNSRVRLFNESFPLRGIRFLQMRDIDVSGATSGSYGYMATPSEIQLYGEGYPVSVWIYSGPISLTDAKGNFIRKTLPRISWEGDVMVHETDPVSGRAVERIDSLDHHPEVRLAIQTRTSDRTDTNYTYYEVVEIGGQKTRTEISQQAYDDLVYRWAIWNKWTSLPKPHETGVDDDKDGAIDEDEIDLIDNDGDGRIDEDGKKLGKGKQPKSSYERDGELAFVGWSEWSSSYEPTAGRYQATITSPNPRRFLQLRVNLLSEDPMKAGRIHSLRIDLAPPLALELVGEVAQVTETGTARALSDLAATAGDYAPPAGIDPLAEAHYSYFLRAAGPDPSDAEVRNGFDEVLLVCPRPAVLEGVRLGTVRVEEYSSPLDSTTLLTRAQETQFTRGYTPGSDGVFRDAGGQALEVRSASPESIYVRLPVPANRGLATGRHAVVEVRFSTRSYQEGLEFSGYIRDSRNPESVFQRADAEAKDATELVDSRTARVSLARSGDGVIQDLAVTEVATPNGDGINDRVSVRFILLKMMSERPVEVAIFDLQGRQVGAAAPMTAKAGAMTMEWDCRGLDGALVPPGIYLCRVRARADQADDEHLRLVHIAY